MALNRSQIARIERLARDHRARSANAWRGYPPKEFDYEASVRCMLELTMTCPMGPDAALEILLEAAYATGWRPPDKGGGSTR